MHPLIEGKGIEFIRLGKIIETKRNENGELDHYHLVQQLRKISPFDYEIYVYNDGERLFKLSGENLKDLVKAWGVRVSIGG